MRTMTLAVALVAFLAVPAYAKHVRFRGPHPIAQKQGGGYCYIEAPHVHLYAPDRPALYHEEGDEFVFTGDPTPFGYDGPKFTYYGNHPVAGAPGVYCYIDGPHYHPYEPPAEPDYRIEKGVAFYVGPFNGAYIKERPHRARLVAAEYRPYVAVRPVVEVAPPPEWHGEVWIAPPSVEVTAPGVVIGAPPPPSVMVTAPAPHVVIGAPPPPHVVIGAPPPPHVVIGAPPPPHVVIGAPPPPRVIVGAPPPVVVVGAPAPVYVGPGREHGEHRGHREHDDDDDRGHEHHDNGKHKGWYK